MADERLLQGRSHLLNGRRALQLGFPSEGRRYFQAALLRFRSPELQLGEGHALRGLAEVALTLGEVEEAQVHIRAALQTYQSLPAVVDSFQSVVQERDPGDQDSMRALAAVRSGAREGEAASWALLGEVLSLQGQVEAAEAALESAQKRFGDLQAGAAGASEIFLAHGRVAQRAGRVVEARAWFERAVRSHEHGGQREGEVVSRLRLAEVVQAAGELDEAYAVLHPALLAARDLEESVLEGRVLCALGEVALEARHDAEAASYFDDALVAARSASDVEREGQALVGRGTASGRRGEPGAIQQMYEGIRILAKSPRQPGLPAALLRLGNHARRIHAPRLALASAEIARRMYLSLDPVQGQGQALRTLVKALAALKQGRATLMAAFARERIAGGYQPNAVDVAAWYADRAPQELLDEVNALATADLLDAMREAVEGLLGAELQLAGMTADSLGQLPGAVGLVELMVTELDDAPAPTRLSVRPGPGRLASAPTEVPLGELEDEDEPVEDAPTEARDKDDGGYRSLDEMYGSLYES